MSPDKENSYNAVKRGFLLIEIVIALAVAGIITSAVSYQIAQVHTRMIGAQLLLELSTQNKAKTSNEIRTNITIAVAVSSPGWEWEEDTCYLAATKVQFKNKNGQLIEMIVAPDQSR